MDPTINESFIDFKLVSDRLLRLSKSTGYKCSQRNGQRFYGPPPNWVGPAPNKGSEIFIGHLPRDCFEDEFVPIFDKVAPIYEVRLMMNFTGYNRGFAYITYCNPIDAWKAVKQFNNFEIRPGHRLIVFKSVDNCRLYIGKIPAYKSKAQAFKEISRICPTIKNIIMFPKPNDRTKNQGYIFVEFETHRAAVLAKRLLTSDSVKLWGSNVLIDWAFPEPDIDPQIMSSITKLFVRNMSPSFTIEYMLHILRSIVPANEVERVYVRGHYGFIHFRSREIAQLVMENLLSMNIEGQAFEVSWARPKSYKKSTNYIRGDRVQQFKERQQKRNDTRNPSAPFQRSQNQSRSRTIVSSKSITSEQQHNDLRNNIEDSSTPIQLSKQQPSEPMMLFPQSMQHPIIQVQQHALAPHNLNIQPILQIQPIYPQNFNISYGSMNIYPPLQYLYNPEVFLYDSNQYFC